MPRFIDPLADLGGLLLEVEKPARYSGGEYGRLARRDAAFQTLIAFPDLYEIGMSNQALRIIYNGLNALPGISCDRAFAPAPDFEQLLRKQGLPLYGLDTGVSLADLDLLLCTLGYELGIGGVLAMLDISGIPLHCDERGEGCPIVIAGGPAVSNPLPYSAFIDAFWIGEAEAGFFDLAGELAAMKAGGEGRGALLERLAAHPNVWTRGKTSAVRAIDAGFAERLNAAVFPVPGMQTVQHHGAVEIMRGCPNGCRFCHAGFWYRPMRQKKAELIIAEAEAFIREGGYREISLSSLSSGDYAGVGELVDSLNSRFADRHISFQLPSLKVSSFSLSLLEKISQTRKSGLTFAVETPVDFWQLAINKQVTRDSVAAILHEAKRHGWRGAKFYFMIGLPVPQTAPGGAEESEIVSFIIDVARRTGMRFNINVGIFVPKPHTPYQWAAQIGGGEAAAKLDYIRSKLKPLGHKVSVSDPVISLLEGILSRGDERAGRLIEEAYRAGSRLDAWQEYINKDAWIAIIDRNRSLADAFVSEQNPDEPLPWQAISAGVAPAYFRREWEQSCASAVTPPCAEDCVTKAAPTRPCGICGKTVSVVNNTEKPVNQPETTVNQKKAGGTVVNHLETEVNEKTMDGGLVNRSAAEVNRNSKDGVVVNRVETMVNNRAGDGVVVNLPEPAVNRAANTRDPSIRRVLFSFCKEGSAVFHGHLSLVEIFSMAVTRSGLPVQYTQGFNPLAKIEIAAPLSTGVSAAAEIAAADFAADASFDGFTERLNAKLPEGIRIIQAADFHIPGGSKKHSLSSLLWGFGYGGKNGETVYVKAAEEKQFRSGAALFSLRRTGVLARNIAGPAAAGTEWASYFDVYRFLYPR